MSTRTRKRPTTRAKKKRLPTAAKEEKPRESKSILAIRIRGESGLDPRTSKTLHDMRLVKRYNAVVLLDDPTTWGMLRRAKDYITWGRPDVETWLRLLEEKAEIPGRERLTPELLTAELKVSSIKELAARLTEGKITPKMLTEAGFSPRFRLHPPRKGFKHSSKRPYRGRGELGDRGDEINVLIRRMI